MEHQQRGSRRRSASAENRGRINSSTIKYPGELLHRQMEEERFGTSTAKDQGEDLHRRTVTAGSTHQRERIKEWIFIGRGSRRASTSTDGGREARNIDIEGSRRRSASAENHGRITLSTKKDHRHGIDEIFYIIRETAPRSSTSTDPGGRISCYFEFSSLQSRVVFVWGWFSLGVHAEIQSGWIASSGQRRRTKETRNVNS